MTYLVPRGDSIRDYEIAEFIKLPGIFTFATLPARPSTINSSSVLGVLAWTTDQGMCCWNGTVWTALGSGGGGGGGTVGPANTPGFGGSPLTDNSPASSLVNYAPTGWSASVSELSIVTSGSAPTVLQTLDSTGRTEGSTAVIDNDGTQPLWIPQNGTGLAGNQFVTDSGQTRVVGVGGSILVRRHNSTWRTM